jgi:hypothetical protein
MSTLCKSMTLRNCNDKDLILIYDEKDMLDSINQQDNKFFLQKLGYDNFNNLEDILGKLYERYNSYHCPHEIGIFLGIPLPDVQAFMNCEEKNCLLCGYWKVFSNEEKAKELFKIYDWSKETFISNSLKGKDLTWIVNTLRIPMLGA